MSTKSSQAGDPSNSAQFLILLTTKLSPPVFRSHIVQRSRLIERLRAGMQRKLTLVVAPAGYGKTTLLSEWLASTGKIGWPVAWISLDPDDNEPLQFWAYVIQALQRADPALPLDGLAISNRLLERFEYQHLVPLINQIATHSHPITLVLDDYHQIKAERIHQDMAYLIDRMPDNMHLVIASRETPPLPLARLRARHQLLEMQAPDLFFNLAESEAFLQEVMDLKITPEDVAHLVRLTEGWIVGLQLAALSMQKRPNVKTFIANFDGSHPYILDYLTEEVLNQQAEPIKNFLLKTSILSELSAPLCDYLLNARDSQEKLAYLERANLLVVPLEDRRRWYRCHTLFMDLLNAQLKRTYPEQVAALHLRACTWLTENGYPAKAVPHALTAGKVELAADIVEACAMEAIRQFDFAMVRHWINRLPEELVWQRPQLGIYFAMANINLGRLDVVEPKLQMVENVLNCGGEACISLEEQERLRREILAARAAAECDKDDFTRGITLAQQALMNLPPEDVYIYGWINHQLGYAYDSAGRPEAAIEAFDRAGQFARQYELPKEYVFSHCEIARVHKMQGHLREAEREYLQALNFGLEAGADAHFIMLAQTGLGDIQRERNELGATAEWMQEAEKYFQQVDDINALSWGYTISVCFRLVRYHLLQNDLEGAKYFFQKARRGLRYYQLFPHLFSDIFDIRVRLWLAEGDFRSVQGWVKKKLDVIDQKGQLTLAEQIALDRIFLAQGKPDQVRSLQSDLEIKARKAGRGERLIQILSLRALALKALGDERQALETFTPALAMAEPEGYVRIFVDEGEKMQALLEDVEASYQAQTNQGPTLPSRGYLAKLLSTFDRPLRSSRLRVSPPGSKPTIISPLVEPLSERELEVLALLVEGKSTGEVAQLLVISIHTVKAHIKRIYQKLDVHNRKEAVERAYKWNILS